jgi:hypothetical protein
VVTKTNHRLRSAMVRAPDADVRAESSGPAASDSDLGAFCVKSRVCGGYLKLGFGGAHTDSNQRLM